MNAALVALALRRTLHPGVAVAALAVVASLAAMPWSPPAEAVAHLAGVDPGGAPTRGVGYQGIWAGALFLLGPLFVLRAAGTVAGWRRGEVAWLAGAPIGATRILLSTWTGHALGLAGVTLAVAVGAALGAGPGREPALHWVEAVELPELALLRAGETRRVEFEDRLSSRSGSAGERARLRLPFHMLGGPTASVRGELARAAGGGRSRSEVRTSTSGALLLDWPPGAGPLVLELTLGEGAAVGFDARAGLLAEGSGSAGAILALHALLAWAAWVALALGAGAWTSPATGAAFALAATVAGWLGGAAPAGWLGAELFDALVLVGGGLVPPAPSPATWGVALAAIALGLGLARWNLSTWTRAG